MKIFEGVGGDELFRYGAGIVAIFYLFLFVVLGVIKYYVVK